MDERTKFQNALRGANGANDNCDADTVDDHNKTVMVINISDTVIIAPSIKKKNEYRAIVLALRSLIARIGISKKIPSYPPVESKKSGKKSEKKGEKFTFRQVNTDTKKTTLTCDKNTYHKLNHTRFGSPLSFCCALN